MAASTKEKFKGHQDNNNSSIVPIFHSLTPVLIIFAYGTVTHGKTVRAIISYLSIVRDDH